MNAELPNLNLPLPLPRPSPSAWPIGGSYFWFPSPAALPARPPSASHLPRRSAVQAHPGLGSTASLLSASSAPHLHREGPWPPSRTGSCSCWPGAGRRRQPRGAGRRRSGSACPRCQPGSGGSWNAAGPSLVCVLGSPALRRGLQQRGLRTQTSLRSCWRPSAQCTRTDSSGRSASSSSGGVTSSLQKGGLGPRRSGSGDPALGRHRIRVPKNESPGKSGSAPGRPETGGRG